MKAFHKVSFSNVVLIGGAMLASLAFAAEPKSAKPGAEFMTMDADKDGKVSADEHATAAKKMFDTMDANRDGKVTATEMDAAHQRVTGKKAKKSDLSAADKIKVIDKDGDKILAAEEHATGSRSMFEKMDTDKDGFLTKSEFAAGHASMLKKPAR
jgi:Ca2+-binding EF-hand superfamily protein